MLSPYGEFILHLANANLAALIGSRICHDLISPVGAVGNGLELMQMAGGKLLPEMALIEESVEAARLRILFFRIAYRDGHTGTDGGAFGGARALGRIGKRRASDV